MYTKEQIDEIQEIEKKLLLSGANKELLAELVDRVARAAADAAIQQTVKAYSDKIKEIMDGMPNKNQTGS